jgi:hypothetical protein
MFFSTNHHTFFAVTALLLATSCLDSARALDEGVTENSQQISLWIEQLSSSSFQQRQVATAALLESGDEAISALQRAEKSATLEQRSRIQIVLQKLQQNSFAAKLMRLKARPTESAAGQMPAWSRFSETVGSDAASLTLFVRLLEAESELFTVAEKGSLQLRNLLEKRSSELLLTARPAALRQRSFSVDAYAAQLLLAADNNLLLRGATSTNLNTLLISPAFQNALNSEDGEAYLKLVGAYILRDRIAATDPLQFARRHRLPQGPLLARRVLSGTVRGHEGLWAMMLLKEQGTAADIPLVEQLFDNQSVLFNDSARTYLALNGDMALAVAITMRNQDPRDYGFGQKEPRVGEFRFALDTIGFDSDQDRQQARQKYEQAFLSNKRPAK